MSLFLLCKFVFVCFFLDSPYEPYHLFVSLCLTNVTSVITSGFTHVAASGTVRFLFGAEESSFQFMYYLFCVHSPVWISGWFPSLGYCQQCFCDVTSQIMVALFHARLLPSTVQCRQLDVIFRAHVHHSHQPPWRSNLSGFPDPTVISNKTKIHPTALLRCKS